LWHNFGGVDDRAQNAAIIGRALELGICHFDLADNYGPPPGSAEARFGDLLQHEFACHRDEMFIATKAGHLMWEGPYGDFGSRKYLLASLDQSLMRMGLDYVDIFYHHRPDPNTPLEETMGALDTAVKSGKALYVGLSNYNGETLRRASAILRELRCPFVINQNRYSIFDRNIEHNGLLNAAIEEKKGVIIFSPLAQGLLTDRYLNGIPTDSRVRTDGRFLKESSLSAETLEKVQKLNNLAKDRGQTLAQMALAWVYAHEGVTSVLIGASKPEQILENLGMLKNTTFTKEEMNLINKISL
jgi:L-glyceraldehyde 3-phosphate reductase